MPYFLHNKDSLSVEGGGAKYIYNIIPICFYFNYLLHVRFTILFPNSLKEFYGRIKAVHLVEAPLYIKHIS